jgi:hypothetical protein
MKTELKSMQDEIKALIIKLPAKIELLSAETAGLTKMLISYSLAGFLSVFKSNFVVQVWPSYKGNVCAQGTHINKSFLNNGMDIVVI